MGLRFQSGERLCPNSGGDFREVYKKGTGCCLSGV